MPSVPPKPALNERYNIIKLLSGMQLNEFYNSLNYNQQGK